MKRTPDWEVPLFLWANNDDDAIAYPFDGKDVYKKLDRLGLATTEKFLSYNKKYGSSPWRDDILANVKRLQ